MIRLTTSLCQNCGRGQEQRKPRTEKVSFLAKYFMTGKSLKRDIPYGWCTRKLSKVVEPLDNQRFSYSSPPFPFPCRPVRCSTDRPVPFLGPVCALRRKRLCRARRSGEMASSVRSGFFPVFQGTKKAGRFRRPAVIRSEGTMSHQPGCGVSSSGSRSTSTLSIMLPSMSTTSKRQPCQLTWSPSRGMRPVMNMNMPLRMV